MQNPILSQLNAGPQNELIRKALTVKQTIAGKDPNALYQTLLQSNPAFLQFVQQNRGKDLATIASTYGVNLSDIISLLR